MGYNTGLGYNAAAVQRQEEWCANQGGHLIHAPGGAATVATQSYCVSPDVQWTTDAAARLARSDLVRRNSRELDARERRDPVLLAKAILFMPILFWPVTLGLVAAMGAAWWVGGQRTKKR